MDIKRLDDPKEGYMSVGGLGVENVLIAGHQHSQDSFVNICFDVSP
jgi:hypothetical protein